MPRLADFLKIRAGEGRLAALVGGVMLATMAGSALGGAGIEALFFARFGVQYLPYMFMALGVMTFITSLGLTALLGRLPRAVLYVALPLAMALLLVGARAGLTLNARWFYPALWLGKEILNTLIGLFSWGLAGAVCDARQAKRLFPLFGAARILGSVLGGLGTGALVSLFGAENLLLAWAACMALAFAFSRALFADFKAAQPPPRKSRRTPSLITEMQQGYRFVRGSALMRWIALAAILFSILYFSIALPFSKAATQAFAGENALAGFLGLFNGLTTGAAFLASLFLANRLYARWGIMRAVLALPVIYLAGFGLLIAYAAFPVIVAFRFAQMLWMSGLADAAYQAMFNAVPFERRDQVRAFIGGVPEQAGTFLAGAILFIGEQTLPPAQLYFVGLIAATLTTFVIWRAGRAYARALVDALRAGRPQLFAASAEEPFGGFQRDAAAIRVAVEGLAHEEIVIRRVSAEILGSLPVPHATHALVSALHDPEPEVRSAALRALARARATPALLEVAARLSDSDSEVRAQAIEAVRQLAAYPYGLAAHIAPLLEDAEPRVRARAAVVLILAGNDPEARALLRQMAVLGETDERMQALAALGEVGDAEAFELVAMELEDAPAPVAVRCAAASALRCFDSSRALPHLIHALSDADPTVRETAAVTLGHFGPAALEGVLAALSNPTAEHGALRALEHLPPPRNPAPLREYARACLARAEAYSEQWRKAQANTTSYSSTASLRGSAQNAPSFINERIQLFADALRDEARRHGLNALRALGLLSERETFAAALDNLQSPDPTQCANALETLEATREANLLRPVLKLWEAPLLPAAPPPLTELLRAAQHDPSAWVRDCAAFAATRTGDSMDTLSTLSLMERILFLRRVPLLSGLTPADLQRVASLTTEHVFPADELIVVQGEPGEEMYIIVAGEVRVLMGEREFARRHPGEVVGEMALISGDSRTASMAAAGEVRVLCLDRRSFESLLRERPDISLAVMRVLCARLKEATK